MPAMPAPVQTATIPSPESLIAGRPVPRFSENALTVLERRYLKKTPDGKPAERPEQMLARVAIAVAEADARYHPDADLAGVAAEFYDLMADREFLPNSPTLMNAGPRTGAAFGLLRAADRGLHGVHLRGGQEHRPHPQERRRHGLQLFAHPAASATW